ncbi:MAG: polyprenyl synthetase family protein [Candidatus Didemnitutus sp.]|nr:polyprenyl synthetase family protein [Candidatus Didemnitutus sp.]
MSGPSSTSVPTASASREVFRHLALQMAALDGFMQAQVASFEPEIRDMAAYCLESTGKRLRPALVFISGWKGEGVVEDPLVRAAGVLEMVHLATLVHDDIMDAADLRRNRGTAARQFGPDAAVLLGDALFSQALHIAAHFPTTEVCRLVSESTRKVCSGEIMQTLHRRDMSVTREDYYRVIDLKTAELFRAACFLGARLAGFGPEFVQAANDFGRHLGIAYQIYDDLVDCLGEEKNIGKTLGTDLASGKLTLPLMLLLEKLSTDERAAVIAAMQTGQPLPLAASVEQMRTLGIAADVAQAVEAELALARGVLEAHRDLAPVPLMLQLIDLLKAQLAALHGSCAKP